MASLGDGDVRLPLALGIEIRHEGEIEKEEWVEERV
jgi:hypothetical protein